MFFVLGILLLILSYSFAGILDPKLKKLIKLQTLEHNELVKVKVLTNDGRVKTLSIPLSGLQEIVSEYPYAESPRKLFPLNDVAAAESYTVFGNGSITVNATGNFSGYIVQGAVHLPSGCQKPYSQLSDYFTCSGSVTFTSSGSFGLILKSIKRSEIAAYTLYRLEQEP